MSALGASSGIGKALAEQLAQEENQVIGTYNQTEKTSDTIKYHHLDVTQDFDIDFIPEQLDGLVYCPGSINLKPFHRLDANDFQNDLEINLFGAIKSIQTCLPALKTGNGSIVLFSTVAVSVGMPFHTSVAAAKGAVEGFARALAAELAPKIRVNVVAPSLTDTPLANKFLNNEQKMENAALRHPLKSVGTADQIAQTAAFLLSDQSSWTTGQVLGVDGGMSRLNLG